MQRRLKVYFDGGCRPNPGQMETAVVARGVIHLRPDCGIGSNNDAEWLALIHAAQIALSVGANDVLMLGDSAHVIGQAGSKRATTASSGYLREFIALEAQFERLVIRRIGRHQNLAGIALSQARWR